MKVLMLSNSLDGGAGGAAHRLHQSLSARGLCSNILVEKKSKNIGDKKVIIGKKTKLVKTLGRLRPFIEHSPLMLYAKRDFFDLFSLQWLPDSIPVVEMVKKLQPDIINLHWICGGYVKIETLSKLKKPMVWTLHDMWAFTGGCHQSLSCVRYTGTCGACPQLHSRKKWDISHWVWKRKDKYWKNLDLTIVAPSSWLAECARLSSLFKNFRVDLIPHGIDTKRFEPINQQEARTRLNLDKDKKIILFGAWLNNRNKGFNLFQRAIRKLVDFGWYDDVEVVIFGFSRPNHSLKSRFKFRYLGRVGHDVLPTVYSAADVFVVPSIIESFGLTILESLSCGTPVVAFKTNGPKELIEHKRNGYLAKKYDDLDIARGITWVLERYMQNHSFAFQLHNNIEKNFSLSLMATRYQALFNEIMNRSTKKTR